MRIDLPICSFKGCRRNFDCNCTATGAIRDGCEFRLMKNAIDQAEEMFPYKVSGVIETYCQYNEGWQDCVDRIKSFAYMK